MTEAATDRGSPSASEAAWLIPVSRSVRFRGASGRTVPSDFDALQRAALADTLVTVRCEVRGPLVDLAPGDLVWCYTAQLDAGVFALARARARPRAANRTSSRTGAAAGAVVELTVNRPRTRVLAGDPLPASSIRRWVPELARSAVSLDARPRALSVLEAWHEERPARDAALLEPLGVQPWRKALRGTGVRLAHDRILGPIARMLRSQDFAVGMRAGPGGRRWLVARRMRDVVLVAPQPMRAGRGYEEAVGGLGPLRELQWQIQRAAGSESEIRTRLWVAAEARPAEAVTQFLEDEDVLVSWPSRSGTVELTDRSKQRWYQHLGIR